MSAHRSAGTAALVLLLSGSWGCSRTVTVRTVSEYGGTPIAGVQVQVDDGEWIATDEKGEAAFRNVSPPFVLSIHQVTLGTAGGGSYRFDDVWVLRDPQGEPVVALVDGSWLARYSATVTGSVSGGHGGSRRGEPPPHQENAGRHTGRPAPASA